MGQRPSTRFVRSFVRAFGLLALTLLLCVTAACASASSSLPGGTYSSAAYHFKITYPSGWQANATAQAGAPAPLILIITRTGARNEGKLISSLTVNVISLQSLGGASQAATQLAHAKGLIPATISGIAGYQDQPTTQWTISPTSQPTTTPTPQPTPYQGEANTTTHTDYYLIHGDYEYQMSTDALAGDENTLRTMAQSFTIV